MTVSHFRGTLKMFGKGVSMGIVYTELFDNMPKLLNNPTKEIFAASQTVLINQINVGRI